MEVKVLMDKLLHLPWVRQVLDFWTNTAQNWT